MEEKYRTYPGTLSPSGRMDPLVGVVVLDEAANKKCVTKRNADGQTLSMLLVDNVILEKHMTYKIQWDLEEMKKEHDEKGADEVSFKYWYKGGLVVLKSFFGSYLVGMMVTLDYTLVLNPKVQPKTVSVELNKDIDFPMVNVRGL